MRQNQGRGGKKLRVDDPRRRQTFVPEKKRGNASRMLLPLLLIGGALFGVSLLIVTFNPFSGEKNGPVAEEVIPEDFSAAGFDFVADEENRKLLYLKPPFSANLSGLGGKYVILVRIWLEVDSFAVAEELNENHAKFRRITDDILQTIKSWTYAELTFSNGMDRLKNQLRDHVNRYISRGKVLKVLFPEIRFDEILPRAVPPARQ